MRSICYITHPPDYTPDVAGNDSWTRSTTEVLQVDRPPFDSFDIAHDVITPRDLHEQNGTSKSTTFNRPSESIGPLMALVKATPVPFAPPETNFKSLILVALSTV